MSRMAEHNGPGLALVFMRPDTRWFQDAVLKTARYLFMLRELERSGKGKLAIL